MRIASRQEQPWERGARKCETLQPNPVGMQKPTRKGRSATGSEFCVVVREDGTKRKQRRPKPCDRASKVISGGCLGGSNRRGHVRAPQRTRRAGPPGSKNTAKVERVRRELGSAAGPSGPMTGRVKPVNNTQACRPPTSRPGRANEGSQFQRPPGPTRKRRRAGRETAAVVAAS